MCKLSGKKKTLYINHAAASLLYSDEYDVDCDQMFQKDLIIHKLSLKFLPLNSAENMQAAHTSTSIPNDMSHFFIVV